ncbi:MAG: exonuclease SbcCD subunit D [Candidatus Thermoplasmatota archaeon]|nr:exonuclease SbcCD subunit D [Candidatus Thermoplasmatota archaeon]
MKILHVADTHIGYSAYHKVNDNGLNQREVDVYDAFKQFVDYAIEKKPDLIVHSGDLFDTVRPTNRAITFALQQIIRISNEGIPMVILSGNHETPKLRETGSVFRIFEHLDCIYPVYKGAYEKYEFDDVTVHAIPHCSTGDDLKRNIENLEISKGSFNLLMMHVGVAGVKEFRTGDFNEQVIPSGYLSPDFDYIALGHYHKKTRVAENAYYSGSTEHLSFKEADEGKGFFEIDTAGNTVNFIPLKIRAMLDVGVIDCSSMTSDEISDEIVGRLKNVGTEGKILRITLRRIGRNVYKGLDFHAIRKIASNVIHFELSYELKEMEQELVSKGSIGSLMEEWKDYISNIAIDGKREEIEKIALKYLSEVSS